jgi:hypothetical protein
VCVAFCKLKGSLGPRLSLGLRKQKRNLSMDFEAGQLEPVTLGRAKSKKAVKPPIRWVSICEFAWCLRVGEGTIRNSRTSLLTVLMIGTNNQ